MQFFQKTDLVLFVLWGLSVVGVYHLLQWAAALIAPRRRKYNPTDSADQLRWVMAAEFSAKRVMSLAEYRVFKEVEAEVQGWRSGHRVFSQTSLGEVLQSTDRRAHSAINSKRVDVLVVGPNGLPVLAVEFQGNGHYQGDAAARDAVKKEALRKAGVAYLEVFSTEQSDDIRRQVREIFGRTDTAKQLTPLRPSASPH